MASFIKDVQQNMRYDMEVVTKTFLFIMENT